MLRQIMIVASRSRDTLLPDVLGAVALMTALVIGLYLPGGY